MLNFNMSECFSSIFGAIFNFLKDATWLQQVESLFVIAGLPTLVIKWIFYRPRLKLKFDPKETYHEAFEVGRKKNSLWLHLMCENNGFVEAKAVNGFLTKVYNFDPERHCYKENNEFRSQLILKWAHEDDFSPRNILPRDKRRLDVCFIYQDDSQLYFSTKYYPSGTAKTLPRGKYKLEVIVTGDNINHPAKYNMCILWNGMWKGIKECKSQSQELPDESFPVEPPAAPTEDNLS